MDEQQHSHKAVYLLIVGMTTFLVIGCVMALMGEV